MRAIGTCRRGRLTLVAVLGDGSRPAAQDPDANRYWAQWRGPHANGVSPTANPPLEWSETKNVRWKVEIPGRGSSSPIVWGDRVFVTTAVPVGITGDAQHAPRGGAAAARHAPLRRHGASIARPARRSGSASRASRNRTSAATSTTARGPRARRSPTASGLRLLRVVRPLRLRHERHAALGEGPRRQADAQPVRRGLDAGAARQHLVVVWDHLNGESFIAALDKRDGKELWRAAAQGDRHLGDAARSSR